MGEWKRNGGSIETQNDEVSKEEISDDVMEKEDEVEWVYDKVTNSDYVYDKAEEIQIKKSDLVPREETIENLVMGYEKDQVFGYSLCMETWYVCEDKEEEFHWKVYLLESQMCAIVEVLRGIKLLLEMNDQQQIVFML